MLFYQRWDRARVQNCHQASWRITSLLHGSGRGSWKGHDGVTSSEDFSAITQREGKGRLSCRDSAREGKLNEVSRGDPWARCTRANGMTSIFAQQLYVWGKDAQLSSAPPPPAMGQCLCIFLGRLPWQGNQIGHHGFLFRLFHVMQTTIWIVQLGQACRKSESSAEQKNIFWKIWRKGVKTQLVQEKSDN